ncbi:MAG TPA: flagellar biosynthesis anti-sigma factor FlgM [Pseudobdellovibrionaceae bacterium]|jgi:negative regulator of flagellin synthesis FlgM
MKITHNKIGQNLNMVDGAKTDRTKTNTSPAIGAEKLDGLEELGASKVEVSPRAQQAKRIKELAMAAPDVDMAKVAKFRQLIDEGKYKVDAKAVADRLVDEQLAMDDLKN